MTNRSDQPDWEAATWAGNRRLQHETFKSLSLRDKVLVLEQMGEVSAVLQAAYRKRANAAASGTDAHQATGVDGT